MTQWAECCGSSTEVIAEVVVVVVVVIVVEAEGDVVVGDILVILVEVASVCSNAASATVLNQGCCKNKFQPENSEQSAVAAVHE